MRTSTLTHAVIIVGAAASIAGCGIDSCHACTAIGCVDQLVIHFATIPTAPVRVELRERSPTDSVVRSYGCNDALSCLTGPVFSDFTPKQLFVTVITSAGTRTTEIRNIKYTEYRPNGPHCDPICRSAALTVDVPG